MNDKETKHWFEELNNYEKRAVIKIKDDFNKASGHGHVMYHPTMYDCAVDFFFDAMSIPT